MFFDRSSGPQAPLSSPSDFSSKLSTNPGDLRATGIKRKRLAALGLAASMAVPALLWQVSRLNAQDAPKPADTPAPAAPAAAAPAATPAPAVDAPKVDAPAAAAPAVEAPKAVDAPKADAPAPAATPAVDAPVPAVPAAAATTPAADAPAPATNTAVVPAAPKGDAPTADANMTGRDYYLRAREEYRQVDWKGARKDFQAAIAAGYDKKPSLFEDSAQTYLARMDKKDSSERAVNQQVTTAAPALTTVGDPAADAALNATARAEDLARSQAESQSTQLAKEARQAENEGRIDEAREKYADAVHLNPSNAAAQAGLDEILMRQGRNPRGPTALTAQEESLKVRREEIMFRFDSSIAEARQAISDLKWDVATAAIQRAELAAGADRAIFNNQDLRNFDDQINATRIALTQKQQSEIRRLEDARQHAANEQMVQERNRAALERAHTIADLKRNAIDLTRQTRYKEALGVVDQILQLDPTDDYALGVRPVLEDRWQFQAQRNVIELLHRKTADIITESDERMVPYDDILHYPSDWPDISATRDQTVQQERGDNKEDRAVTAQLNRSLPEVSFDGVGFSDVVDFLRDVSGANIFVNWKTLEGAGIDKNAPVSAKLRNIKFSKALGIILDSVGGSTAKLVYSIDDGVITISTADDLSKNTITRVYDIRDLIINIPDFTDAPDFSLNSTSNNQAQSPQGGGGIGGGGGGGGGQQQGQLFGGSDTKEKPGPTREELVEQITKLITDTIASESWKDAGGMTGSIRELQGQLIVTQTPENQKQLVNLLEQLRETRAIQVTVETRFLTVQRNFLEDVGVDLSMVFNLNGNLAKNISPISVTNSSSQYTLGPTTSVPGSIGKTATSLTTSATYLDDFQVSLLLRATEASLRSTFVTAPRVTLFNGQRAYVLVATQQAYVSNLTAQVGTGVSAFTPVVSVVESGVLLDVTATVSADRKYVTLTLRPQLATLLDLASFNFQSGSSGSNIGGLGVGGVVGQAGVPGGTIQEPEIQITEVKTTVSVPDGGTLLLGGQTLSGETEKEAGVPVLSKIPFLKRLFTNRSMAKDEQILLILVKPTIIIEKEIEQKQFPLLTSKLGG